MKPIILDVVFWVQQELSFIIPIAIVLLGIILFIIIRSKGIGEWREVGSWDFNCVYGPDRTVFFGRIPKRIKANIPKKGFSAGVYQGKKARKAWGPVTHCFQLGRWQYQVYFRWGESSCYGYVYKRPTILTRIKWLLKKT